MRRSTELTYGLSTELTYGLSDSNITRMENIAICTNSNTQSICTSDIGTLLQNMVELKSLTLSNRNFVIPELPITELHIGEYPNKIDFTKFPNLTILHLGNYIHEIDFKPLQLTKLYLENYSPTIDFSTIPTLKTLHMGYDYINIYCPNLTGVSLKAFTMNFWYNSPIDLSLQTELYSLTMSSTFNQPIDLTSLKLLVLLVLSNTFNLPIYFSPTLQGLDLGRDFNQDIDFTKLRRLSGLDISKAYSYPVYFAGRYLNLWEETAVPIQLYSSVRITKKTTKKTWLIHNNTQKDILKTLHSEFPSSRFYHI